MTEEHLAELLSFVTAEHPVFRRMRFGPGLTSHPRFVDDENAQRIHAGLLVLEQRGLVYRHHESPDGGTVTWMPTSSADQPASPPAPA